MKASELRLGNYVWNEVQNIPVTVDIKIISEQFYRANNPAKLWQPIPLTEEWLINLGFISDNNYGGIGFRLGNMIVYKCYTDVTNKKGLLFEVEYCSDNSVFKKRALIMSDVGYVHTLQNLVFALKRIELKTK